MKLDIGDNEIIVGKRIAVGAVLGSIAKIFATLYPENATIFYESGLVLTFIVQIILANYFSITTKDV